MNILIIEDEPRAANQLQNLLNNLDFEHEVLDVLDVRPIVIVISGKASLKEEILGDPQVVDFLDKPIDPDKFKQAVDKAIKAISHS